MPKPSWVKGGPRIVKPIPGPRAKKLVARDKRVMSPSYTRAEPIVADEGWGCYVRDVDGNVLLDISSGMFVLNYGYSHPRLVRAVERQAAKLTHFAGTDFYYEAQVELAERLANITPGKFAKRVYFGNSGAEAVEAAFKCVRWHTRRPRMIAFTGGFHGRTFGALSLTSNLKYTEFFAPLVPGVSFMPFPDPYRPPLGGDPSECAHKCIEYLRDSLRTSIPPKEVAAVITEPIQGTAGYIIPPPEFYPMLKELCEEHDWIFIADEVQTGLGRTGKMFAMEHWGVVPDIVCVAKALAGGMAPIGATIANAEVMDWEPGAHACFHRRAKVILADGTREEISKIVNKKLNVKVLSYNPTTGLAEPKEVVNWFKMRNNKNVEWYKVITSSSINGTQAPCVTKEHKFWVVGKGLVTVENLRKGDKILVPVPSPSEEQEQVILGSLLGDGNLSKPKTASSNAKYPHLSIGHASEQLGYLEFKYAILKNLTTGTIKKTKGERNDGYTRQEFFRFITKNLPWLLPLRTVIYQDGSKRHITTELVNRLNPIGLAIWYMDDGHYDGKWRASISTAKFSEESLDTIIKFFKDRHAIEWKKYPVKLKNGGLGHIIYTVKKLGSERFFEMISPYVVDCMQYKLPKKYRNKNSREKDLHSPNVVKPSIGEVVKIVKANGKKRDLTMYDIEVEGNHNYFIPTALVSNSTFGGNLIACAAAIEGLKILEEQKLVKQAAKLGDLALKRLQELKEESRLVGDVRGKGLLLAVEMVKDKNTKEPAVEERDAIVQEALNRGLIVFRGGKSAIRIAPPLTISQKEFELGLDIFGEALHEVDRKC